MITRFFFFVFRRRYNFSVDPNAGWLFQYGDREEMEIRGCSIWAVELVCESLRELFEKKGQKMSNEINPVLIDHFLWDYARDYRDQIKDVPFHRVRCIYY